MKVHSKFPHFPVKRYCKQISITFLFYILRLLSKFLIKEISLRAKISFFNFSNFLFTWAQEETFDLHDKIVNKDERGRGFTFYGFWDTVNGI